MSSKDVTPKSQVFQIQQYQRPIIDIKDFKLKSILDETFSEMSDNNNIKPTNNIYFEKQRHFVDIKRTITVYFRINNFRNRTVYVCCKQ